MDAPDPTQRMDQEEINDFLNPNAEDSESGGAEATTPKSES